jgi:PRC-barrel domain
LFELQKRDGAVGTPRIAQRCCLNAKQEYITMQATAHPDHRLISSEDVHCTDVYGIGEEAIGEIDHLLIEKLSGRVAYAVMSFGGFLGLAQGCVVTPC